jgi:hypothetical protein
MSSNDHDQKLKEAREWAKKSTSQPETNQSKSSWLPIIIITILFLAAAWWWWANYSNTHNNNSYFGSTLTALKQGAKNQNSKLVVKPNGSVVSSSE